MDESVPPSKVRQDRVCPMRRFDFSGTVDSVLTGSLLDRHDPHRGQQSCTAGDPTARLFVVLFGSPGDPTKTAVGTKKGLDEPIYGCPSLLHTFLVRWTLIELE